MIIGPVVHLDEGFGRRDRIDEAGAAPFTPQIAKVMTVPDGAKGKGFVVSWSRTQQAFGVTHASAIGVQRAPSYMVSAASAFATVPLPIAVPLQRNTAFHHSTAKVSGRWRRTPGGCS